MTHNAPVCTQSSCAASRYCVECGKAHAACICAWIQSLHTEVSCLILQHPTEVKRPMGTARILTLSLPNAMCLVGENFTDHPQLNQWLSEPNVHHVVVYPNESAQPVSQWYHQLLRTMSTERSDNTVLTQNPRPNVRFILLDGTWKKAYKIWQLSRQLHSLPTVRLPEELVGQYVIRKAPRQDYLSTVEAGYHMLNVLEPTGHFQPLLDVFQKMVDHQLQHMSVAVRQRYE